MPNPRPLITLTNDFGMAGGTVGAMIGVIKSICPDAEVINLACDIPPQDIVRGAWALFQAAPFFPSATIHVAVIDLGVGTERRGLLVTTDHGRFIGPDNGVLSWALRNSPNPEFRSLENPVYRLAPPGFTFDGRDLFAPVAAHLAAGLDPSQFGPVIHDPVELPWHEPQDCGDAIVGEIFVVDSFGNMISNISMTTVAARFGDVPLQVTVGEMLASGPVRGYAGIPGPLGVIINGTGFLEIAARDGSAARRTGLGRGATVRVAAARGIS